MVSGFGGKASWVRSAEKTVVAFDRIRCNKEPYGMALRILQASKIPGLEVVSEICITWLRGLGFQGSSAQAHNLGFRVYRGPFFS